MDDAGGAVCVRLRPLGKVCPSPLPQAKAQESQTQCEPHYLSVKRVEPSAPTDQREEQEPS